MKAPSLAHAWIALALLGCDALLGLETPRLVVDEDSGLNGGSGNAGAFGDDASFGGSAGVAEAAGNGGAGAGGARAGSSGAAGSGGAGGAGGAGIAGASGAGGSAAPIGGQAWNVPSPSCAKLSATACAGASCCEARYVPGGSFPLGRYDATSAYGTNEDAFAGQSAYEVPQHQATVEGFYLDRFEVTVGRFRQFVSVYDTWRATHPVAGEGAHAHPNLIASGWPASASSTLAPTAAVLTSSTHIKCDSSFQSWTDLPTTNEQHPQNCTRWIEAFAFCIWDGGYLPTEAEWEMAAAGGSENRLFPWGNTAADAGKANYAGTDSSPFMAVGSYPAGRGRFGHDDLAGNVSEWVRDWYVPYSAAPCDNCASLNSAPLLVVRGGNWGSQMADIRSAARYYGGSDGGTINGGWRCARTP